MIAPVEDRQCQDRTKGGNAAALSCFCRCPGKRERRFSRGRGAGVFVFQFGEKSLATLQGVDCGEEIVARIALAEKAMRAQAPCFFRNLAMRVDSNDENLDGWIGCENFAAGIKTTDVWHADVQQDQVGLALSRFLDYIVAVDSLAADLQIRAARDQGTQATADPLVVIGYQNSKESHYPPSLVMARAATALASFSHCTPEPPMIVNTANPVCRWGRIENRTFVS